jgi:response regulator RpfG family c-di-GMP phosphodiesterase
MARIDRESLSKITVYVGEKNYYERNQLRDMFKAQGITQVCHSSLASLREVVFEQPPDILFISDDFDPEVFGMIEEIRHHKLGDNPFLLVTMLISPNRPESLDAAIRAGVDDIIVKPLSPERVRDRLRLVTFHRQPFVVTDTYLGPQRKNMALQGRLRRIPVLNTVLEKVNGREFDKNALREAVEGSLQQVLQAQLDRQSFRLGEVCVRVVRAYEKNEITEEVQTDLIMLADVLQQAGDVATRLRDAGLSQICTRLSDNVRGIADHYDDPSSSEIDLIRKVTAAFKSAMQAGPAHIDEQPDAVDLSSMRPS